MKVLVTGITGQLGRELLATAPAGLEVVGLDRPQLDLADPEKVGGTVRALRPDMILNAAAYTAVDRAESEHEAAFLVNGHGVAALAAAVLATGARLVQVSTDFVFDGRKSSPYLPDDTANPLGVYGASKLAGEEAARRVLGEAAIVVRTSWVYSAHGANFVKTMLRLMAERHTLGVVADQVSTPTWARGLARALWALATRPEAAGIHQWSDAGVASWYDFAVAIQEEALTLGLLSRPCRIRPLRTEDYPTPARRPAYSVLDKTSTWALLGEPAPHWRGSLREMLKSVRAEG